MLKLILNDLPSHVQMETLGIVAVLALLTPVLCVCVLQSTTLREVRQAVGEGKAPSGGMTSKLQEPLPPTGQGKPARTGAIKPQAVKVEEGKA